tara:strand:+ start:5764 stop:6132 length:369 start_codon:yes stop_codon:yes gene_type:complete
MDVLGGDFWIPPGIVQYIQDKDPSLRLCYICKDITIKPVQWGIQKLSGKKLKGKLGGPASIMFAYSSGEIEHLRALLPLRVKNSRHLGEWRLNYCRTYQERMGTFRTILWIPMAKHLKHLKI